MVRELEGCGVGARSVTWRDREEIAVNRTRGGLTASEEVGDEQKERGEDDVWKPQAKEKEEEEEVQDNGRRNRNIIILLVTPQEATKGVREAMAQSRWPMAYLKISLKGRIEQLLWNRTAAAVGLQGINVVLRHVPKEAQRAPLEGEQVTPHEASAVENDVSLDDDVGLRKPKIMEQEVVLTWQGDVWEWPLQKVETSKAETAG